MESSNISHKLSNLSSPNSDETENVSRLETNTNSCMFSLNFFKFDSFPTSWCYSNAFDQLRIS